MNLENVIINNKISQSNLTNFFIFYQMLTNNFAVYGVKIITELITDILMFPVWWYSRGLFGWIRSVSGFLSNREKSIGLFVWIKNLFTPMYGQHDWQGRLISFFMRLVQIVFRGIFMLFWLIFSFLLIVAWLVLPVLVVYEIVFQLL
jgi:hypothetical protein